METEEKYHLPASTYMYSTQIPLIIQYKKAVSIDSFWLRLHRSPHAYMERIEGTRTVQVFSNSRLVAETTFLLTSDEWVLI